MALVKNLYFGTPSGRVGDLVYRQIEAKKYVCRRPANRTSPCTPKEIANKIRFSRFTKKTVGDKAILSLQLIVMKIISSA